MLPEHSPQVQLDLISQAFHRHAQIDMVISQLPSLQLDQLVRQR
jgi:hypothetical protein